MTREILTEQEFNDFRARFREQSMESMVELKFIVSKSLATDAYQRQHGTNKNSKYG